MKHQRSYIALFVFLTLFVNVVLSQNDIKFEHISVEQGLSQSSVYDIYQDYQGFVWFASGEGLNKYDGYNITVYKHDLSDSTSIYRSWCTAIFEDSDSTLWIGTYGGGVNRFNREKENFTRFIHLEGEENSLSSNIVFSIYESHDGKIWVGTQKGISIFDKKTETFTRLAAKHKSDISARLSQQSVTSICETRNQFVWAATENAGVFQINTKSGEIRQFVHQPDNENTISHNTVSKIIPDTKKPDEILWIATMGGLDQFNTKTGTFTHFRHIPGNPESLSSNRIKDFFINENGDLWLGTEDNGVSVLTYQNRNKARFTNFKHNPTVQTSLSKNLILSLFQDKSGTVWIGTKGGGVNRTIKSDFLYYRNIPDNPNSLSSNSVWSIFECSDGFLWVGTEKGLNKMDKKTQKFTHYEHNPDNPNSISDNIVYSITEDKDGYLWLGTYKGGLNRFDKETGQFVHFTHNPDDPESINFNYIKSVRYDSRGLLWIGTRGKGLDLFDRENERFIHFTHNPENKNSLSHNRINTVFEDSNGTLWIGTSGGGLNKLLVSDYENPQEIKTQFTCYTNIPDNPHSLNDIYVMSVAQDSTGNLWVGTWYGGLNKFNPDKETFKHITERDGLPNNVVYGILPDSHHNLWLSTNKGVVKCNPKELIFEAFDAGDGLQGNEFNSGSYYKSPSGQMFFGGINGFNAFYPDSLKNNAFKPPVVITDFKIFNQSVKPGTNSPLRKPISQTKHITLTYKEYIFSFEFVALSYISQHKNQYAYKMEGLDKNWIYTDAQNRTATYTNLSGGDYVFKVKASNNDGVWNKEGTEIKITILPPFWETWWFRISVIAAIFIIAFLWYKSRISRIKKQNERLEQQVLERTAKIRKQKEEIQKQSEVLKEANVQLEEQQEEIQQQAEELSAQAEALKLTNSALEREKEHTIGSIRYAKTIQNAILPIKDNIDKWFDAFVVFRPKDIVSGDFYWFSRIEDAKNPCCFFAVVDCTGHGVPGAFMSMIGSRLLNEIVNERQIYAPKQILETLDKETKKALKQKETDNNDGMDIALCRFDKIKQNDKKKCRITFSGAKRPLLLYKNQTKQFDLTKGDRRSIGGVGSKKSHVSFTDKEIIVESNDIVYLYSDGYIDQNNPQRRRFGTPGFLNLLSQTDDLSLIEQKKLLEITLDEFQKDEPQRDDITIVGLKIKDG